MATDQPTPPNLGNLSDAQLRALPDWAVKAVNQVGKDDTFASMEECVVALVYRLLLENIAYINLAFACEVDTPLSLAAKAVVETPHWRETDWPAIALTQSSLTGISPQPDIVFTCDGTALEAISGALSLTAGNPTGLIQYSIVSARGSTGASPVHPFVLGLRTHALRWVYSTDTAVVRSQNIAYQASYSLPEWPQDNSKPIVLAKVANFTTASDTGANRIGFEFGLGTPGIIDEFGEPRDYSLYVKWFEVGDSPRTIYAQGGAPNYPSDIYIGVTPGRRVTLGFHRYFDGSDWRVRFYVNGREVADNIGVGLDEPSISASSDVRLHIGSAQLGESYTGGPVNNVAVWADAAEGALDAAMLAMYQRGEGFQVAP
jgi:hypothetical protein